MIRDPVSMCASILVHMYLLARCLKRVSNVCQTCLKRVSNVSQTCLKLVSNLCQTCVHSQLVDGWSALHIAAYSNKIKRVKALLVIADIRTRCLYLEPTTITNLPPRYLGPSPGTGPQYGTRPELNTPIVVGHVSDVTLSATRIRYYTIGDTCQTLHSRVAGGR